MMKKALFAVLIGLVLGKGPTLFAQEKSQRKQSEYYYVSVDIEKIYLYRTGYVVSYRKGANKIATTYIPHSWFNDPDGKAEEIGLGTGKAWPSMTVYYKNGEFSHVRLHVRRSRSHESWGIIPLNVNLDEHFEGVEEIKLEF
jgi:hypothetical protein